MVRGKKRLPAWSQAVPARTHAPTASPALPDTYCDLAAALVRRTVKRTAEQVLDPPLHPPPRGFAKSAWAHSRHCARSGSECARQCVPVLDSREAKSADLPALRLERDLTAEQQDRNRRQTEQYGADSPPLPPPTPRTASPNLESAEWLTSAVQWDGK
jgi:hypothetical protein